MLQKVANLVSTLRFLREHPLASRRPWHAATTFARWQLGSRLLPGAVVVPFVDEAKLVVEPGMLGATGNVYAGLHEFEEMSFLLHLLRRDDGFLDVGANVGTYSILAAAVCKAHATAVEPVALSVGRLRRNVQVNDVAARVTIVAKAIGPNAGKVRFTTDLDTINHVAAAADHSQATVEVEMTTIDAVCAQRVPRLIKVDVEGFEQQVLAGAANTLASPSLHALIIELNSHASDYGGQSAAVRACIEHAGFFSVAYDAFARALRLDPSPTRKSGNIIYVRDVDAVAARLRAARHFHVLGQDV